MTSSPHHDDLVERFTMDDMLELFGKDWKSPADPEFMQQFLNTFSQQADSSNGAQGRPSSDTPSNPPELTTVAVKLRFSTKIFIMSGGIPSSNRIPTNTRTVDYTKDLKLPIGSLFLLHSDHAFQSNFFTFVFEAQRPLMAQQCPGGTLHCTACGRSGAQDFISRFDLFLPSMERWAKVMTEGATMSSEHAFPICTSFPCNRKVLGFIKLIGGRSYQESKLRELRSCENCRKAEVRGKTPDFRKCSRCKLVYYCSRDCQKADWKQHKKICM